MIDCALVFDTLDREHRCAPITCLIEGGATGADRFAQRWRIVRNVPGLTIPVTPSEWQRYGKAAGPRRNVRMLKEGRPDRVIAFIAVPPTPGTAHMIGAARRARLPVAEIIIPPPHFPPLSR